MNPMIIAALLTGGGALVNHKIQNDAIKAQNAENRRAMEIERLAREAERARQAGMEKLQADEVTRALFAADPPKRAEEVQAAADAPDNEFVTGAEDYNIATLGGQKADSVVAGDIGKIVSDALQRTKGMLKAQSVLSGQGTSMGATQDDLARMASTLSTVGSNRRGSANVAAMETAIPAARVTPSDSPIGDLMMLGGMLYGGTGGFGAASKPMAAPGMGWMQPNMLQQATSAFFKRPLTLTPTAATGLPAIY